MASRLEKVLDLTSVDEAQAWLLAFEAKCKVEGIVDTKTDNNMALRFISNVGLEPLKKIREINLPNDIMAMNFLDLKKSLLSYLVPTKKLIIAERTKYFKMAQQQGDNVAEFVAKLRKAAESCDFENLKSVTSINDELLLSQLIVGLIDSRIRAKVIEANQIKPMTLSETMEFIQQHEQINTFCSENKSAASVAIGEEILHANDTNKYSQYRRSKHISKSCSFCGGKWHQRRTDCPAYGVACRKCGKKSHYAKVCKSKATFNENKGVMTVNLANNCLKLGLVDLNGVATSMLWDTGASCSVISTWIAENIQAEVIPNNSVLETYDGHVMNCVGEAIVTAKLQQSEEKLKVKVVKCNKTYGLLGRDAMPKEVILNVEPCYLPTIKGVKATIQLKENQQDRFCAARKVPLSMKQAVESEIQTLLTKGVIKPAPSGGLKNCSPVVWVKKSNGRLRMCPDFKVHVNERICTESYPLPEMETMFEKLHGAKFFAKVDLSDAYWQIELEEDAQRLCAINTTCGLFYVTRLQMGLKNSSAIFQQIMEQSVLKGLQNVIAYQDDLVIYGKTEANLQKNLNSVLGRLKEKNVTVNRQKCVECTQTLNFLGRTLTPDGISPQKELVDRITSLSVPTSRKELQSVLGLFGFYRSFISHYSQKVQKMQALLSAQVFKWTQECDREFQSIKNQLAEQPILSSYSLDLPVEVTTDASMNSVAAVLSQNQKPVLFISKKLSESQSRWSNIEREAYAIVWSLTRLRQFLLGRKFTLLTDHRPLIYIFAPDKKIPTHMSARIGRWAIKIMAYNFDINYKSGLSIPHVDALSRLPDEREAAVIFNLEESIPNMAGSTIKDKIRAASLEDQQAIRVKSIIRTGNWSKSCRADSQFKKARQALTVEEDLIFNGTRIFVPLQVRRDVIHLAHDTHMGELQQFRKVQQIFWWPGMKADVENYVKCCTECQRQRKVKPSHTTKWASAEPWERLHIDWAYLQGHGNILIVVDAATNYIDAIPCPNRSNLMVKRCFSRLFSLFGYPRTVVSDNAPEFISLRSWLERQGVTVKHAPTYHPQSNGQAERAVGTIKRSLLSWTPQFGDWFIYLQKVLLNHRGFAGAAGESPGERLLKRSLRTAFNFRYQLQEPAWYQRASDKKAREVKVATQWGDNTAIVVDGEQSWMASFDQIARRDDADLQTPTGWRSSRVRCPPDRLGWRVS